MSARRQGFGGDRLLAVLDRWPRPRRYWVGFSGGADSTALLQALHDIRERLGAELQAIHFHHGLQAAADDWDAHCRAFCAARDIALRVERLELDPGAPGSLEEAARDARYRAIESLLETGDVYLTAHQAEDQAETLFLNLMRGSGVEGLAGIPPLRRLGRGWVGRPLLDVERGELLTWLEARGIDWLEDPSNRDLAFDRNYLRQSLFPLLERRWPGVSRRLARTARHARQAAQAVASWVEDRAGDLLRDDITLPAGALLELETELQALVLREWLRRNEIPPLPEARLAEFLQQLASPRSGSQAEVRWSGWLVKRYRDTLWLQRADTDLACRGMEWQTEGSVALGPGAGRLELGDRKLRPPPGWSVGPRQPGDRIRTVAGAPSRKLKHCFQDRGVPPWLRPGVPVLRWDGEPVALGDAVFDERLGAWLAAHGTELTWRPSDPALESVRDEIRKTRP